MGRSISFDVSAIDKASKALSEVGREVADLDRKIDAAGGSIQVDADTAKAQQQLRAIDSQLARLNAKSFKVDADTAAAERDLKVLGAELTRATGDRKVKVEADISVAQARLRALASEKVSIDVDTGAAQAKVRALDAQIRGKKFDLDTSDIFAKLTQVSEKLKAIPTPVTIAIGVAGALEAMQWIGSVSGGLVSIGAVAVTSAGIAAAAFKGVSEAVAALGEEGPGAADKVREAMEKLTPEGQRFAVMLRALVDGPLKDLQSTAQSGFLPGLQQGIQGFVTNLGTAQESIRNVAENLGGFFRDIGPAAGRAAEAFLRLASLGSGPGFSSLSTTVSNMLDSFTRWANSQSPQKIAADIQKIGDTVTSIKDKVVLGVGLMQAAWTLLTFPTDLIRAPIQAITDLYNRLRSIAEQIPGLKGKFPELAAETATYGTAASGAAGANERLATAQQTVMDKLRQSKEAFAGSEQAQITYGAALDRAKASIETNGATLSTHTAKGRENRQALLDMATAANGVVTAMEKQGAPLDQVKAKYDTQRTALINVATQMGLTKTQAQQYVDKLLTIPAAKQTSVTAPGATTATTQVKGVTTAVLGVPGSKIVKIDGNTSGIMGAINAAKNALASIRDKVVNIVANRIGLSAGGWVPGGPSSRDTVDTKLAGGEFVVRSGAAARWGPMLEAINAGAGASTGAAGGTLTSGGTTGTSAGASVLNVYVTNAIVGNNDELARVVVTALREAVARGLLPTSALGAA